MDAKENFCRTEKPRRGRPPKRGRSVRVTIRLREGEQDDILARLERLDRGRRSAYIRRVLAGAPVEDLDRALAQESEALASDLDGMWADDWDDDEL